MKKFIHGCISLCQEKSLKSILCCGSCENDCSLSRDVSPIPVNISHNYQSLNKINKSIVDHNNVCKISCFSLPNAKKNSINNLDRIDIKDNENSLYIGIYDGHQGDYVCEMLNKHLYKYFEPFVENNDDLNDANNTNDTNDTSDTNKSYNPINPISPNSISQICRAFQEFLINTDSYRAYKEGAVCTIMIYNGTILQFVNIGDSRSIICINGKAVQATHDHDANNENEIKRIEKIKDYKRLKIRTDRTGIQRIGNLGPTRAFGDTQAYPYVDAIPDVSVRQLIGNEQFVVTASDGLWNAMKNQDVVDFIFDYVNNNQNENTDYDNCAKELCKFARQKGSNDDISVVIFWL